MEGHEQTSRAGDDRQSFGYDGLDLRLAEYLCFEGGTFVEAGAHDGLTYSNTAFFERYRGWSGLLIEPIPELAKQCRLNRPASTVEQAALVSDTYNHRTIDMHYCNLGSLVRGARGSDEEDLAWVEAGQHSPSNTITGKVRHYQLTVPARTLSELLDTCELPHCDLLSLDVEGYEVDALMGLELARNVPTYILVEVSHNLRELEAILSPRYEPVAELSDHRKERPPWYDVLYRAR